MRISERTAKKYFLELYPNGVGYDFAGRKMLLEDYGNASSDTGWNIDHIKAVSNGGTNKKNNLQCTNMKTNRVKSNKDKWSDNDMEFKTITFEKGFKVVKVSESHDEKEYNLNEKEFATKLFKQKFPLGVGYDPVGRLVRLEDYQKKEIYCGWDIVKLNPNNKSCHVNYGI